MTVEISPDTRIVVTGGSGFLGRHVVAELRSRGYRNVGTFRSAQYDLTHESQVARMIDELKPEAIIHGIAQVLALVEKRVAPIHESQETPEELAAASKVPAEEPSLPVGSA